jgi:hypothetical protein
MMMSSWKTVIQTLQAVILTLQAVIQTHQAVILTLQAVVQHNQPTQLIQQDWTPVIQTLLVILQTEYQQD